MGARDLTPDINTLRVKLKGLGHKAMERGLIGSVEGGTMWLGCFG